MLPHAAANPRRKNRAAHRGRAGRRQQRFRWRVDCELRGRHVFGQQQQRGRRHQRQDYRSDRQRHRQSRRQGVRHLQRQWHHGYHGRPPVRPQRRRNVPAIGRLHRKVDSGETVALLRAHLDTRHLDIGTSHYGTFNSTYDRNDTRLALDLGRHSERRAGAIRQCRRQHRQRREIAVRFARGAARGRTIQSRHDAPNLNPTSHAAHRGRAAAVKAMAVAAAISMVHGCAVAVGTPCGSSSERFVISGGRISGELSSGSVSPNGSTRTGGSVQGLSWNSTGRFSGRTGSGSFVRSDGCSGRWTASKQ